MSILKLEMQASSLRLMTPLVIGCMEILFLKLAATILGLD
jgi:hypothetical protein